MLNILLASLFLPLLSWAQNEQTIEKTLLKLFVKIEDNRLSDNKNFPYDSLAIYNKKFEESLSDALVQHPQTIYYSFKKKLKDAGSNIITSTDKSLRLYSWDDMPLILAK